MSLLGAVWSLLKNVLKSKIMLSIIVPIYKTEEFLPQCIESILSQSFQDFELILVDDGSPDNCSAICDEYAKKDRRIVVIHKQNGGLVSARKAGLMAAKGDYIGYVDGDDWVEPGFYQGLMNAAAEKNADIAVSGFIKEIGDNCILKRNAFECRYYSKKELETEIYPKMMFDETSFEPGLFTYVWNKVFKKTVLYPAQMSVPDTVSLGEDAACVYPAVINADSVCIIDDCLYHYRQRADSMLKASDNYRGDYCGYKQLYSYLNAAFEKNKSLQSELLRFILYLITTRYGGVHFQNDEPDWYLFNKAPEGTVISVYGAGTLGQHLVKRLTASGRYIIKKWVDEDFETLRNHGLPVDAPESVGNAQYDNIVIAFLNEDISHQIRNRLICDGIPEERIIVSDFQGADAQSVLQKFGIIQS